MEKVMKTVLFVLPLLLASCLFAEDKPTQTAFGPGCGPAHEKFDVSTTRAQPGSAPLEDGKAMIYVIPG